MAKIIPYATTVPMFRRAETSDEPFLFELFVTSRERELLPLPAEFRDRFARHQYDIFCAGIRDNYPGADHFVLDMCLAEEDQIIIAPAGGIVFIEGDHSLLLIDLAIQPAHRNRGIGSAVLKIVMDRCRESKKAITASVTPYNPARRFYARHGFIEKQTQADYIGIEWRPGWSSSSS